MKHTKDSKTTLDHQTSKLAKTHFMTRALHDTEYYTQEFEHSEPIFMNSGFDFSSAEQAAKRFSGEEIGNVYGRFTNPTTKRFEQRLATLELMEKCVATSSGMVAILTMFLSLLKSGDEIIASQSLFGSTILLMRNYMSKFGINTSFINSTKTEDWATKITTKTRLLFIETPSNPNMQILNIQELANLAHNNNALLAVDNCLCTPAIQNPATFGADIITHSLTKYIDGQGRTVGGAVLCSQKLYDEYIYSFHRSAGATLSPMHAWIYLKGLETLHIRMQSHSNSALSIASWLENHPKIQQVLYPGLTSHPQKDLVFIQQSMSGGMLSFYLKNKHRNVAWKFIDSLQLIKISTNLGSAKTMITHPASTTHTRITAEERKTMNISNNMLRLSVGLESADDVIRDLDMALGSI